NCYHNESHCWSWIKVMWFGYAGDYYERFDRRLHRERRRAARLAPLGVSTAATSLGRSAIYFGLAARGSAPRLTPPPVCTRVLIRHKNADCRDVQRPPRRGLVATIA